jgi:glycosyltransferase involved in cell wall biosynthesis
VVSDAAPAVLICVENLPPRRDRRVWREACALRDAGYVVAVAGPAAPGDPRHQVVDGIEVHTYRAPGEPSSVAGFVWEYAYSFAMTAVVVARVARRHRLAAVQVCNPPDIFFPLGWVLRRRGVRFVFDHHDLVPELFRTRFGDRLRPLATVLGWCERLTMRAADHVVATNESYRRIAMGRGRVPAGRVTVVRNGPELATMYRRQPRPELRGGQARLVVWFGNMGPSDGVDGALEAIRQLVVERGRRDVRAAFVGRGEVLDDMRALADQLGIADRVTFTGWVEDEVAFAYLSTADVGLSADPPGPLNDVSTMNKTLEYMAFGLPVVAYDLIETRTSAGPAALYASGGPDGLADCVAKVLDDRELASQLGRAGRERIEAGLAWDHQRATYVSLYDDLLGRTPADEVRTR